MRKSDYQALQDFFDQAGISYENEPDLDHGQDSSLSLPKAGATVLG